MGPKLFLKIRSRGLLEQVELQPLQLLGLLAQEEEQQLRLAVLGLRFIQPQPCQLSRPQHLWLLIFQLL